MGKNKKLRRKYFKHILGFWILYFVALFSIILLFVIISNEKFGPMPTFEELENPKSNLASEVYSADSMLLGTYYIENRSNVHYQDLSNNLINALLAAEDIRFEEHSGIDHRALLRTFYGVALNVDRGGGSTITQQLAKNLFPRERNPSTLDLVLSKFKEWITAVKLERNYSKEEIIAMYFNTVPFGSHSFGIKSASKTFFNKTPDSLNVEEAALMVGVVNAPTKYNPIRNPNNAFKKRNIVISQMAKYGYVSKPDCDSIKEIQIDMSNFRLQAHNTGIAQHFREYLRTTLKNWCCSHFKADGTPYNLYKDGLKIYTTIDSRMQKYAEEAVSEHLGKTLQPDFYKHWEDFTNAPYVFEEDESDSLINLLMTQAMKRSERYRTLKLNEIPFDSIELSFNTPTEMTVFSWDGEIDTIMTPMDSIRYYKFFLRSGFMSMESHTGFVKAYVGGPDYKFFKYDPVKYGKRQIGSTFKPFLYTLAMQAGEYSPCSKVPNVQQSIDLPDGTKWEPANSSKKKENEMVSLKWALANSINWVSAYLMKQYSPQSVRQIAKKMGVTSYIPAVPAICLGSPDISLYEMVGAMNTFANKGIYIEPIFITKIEDKFGNIIDKFSPKQTEAMSEETAYLMADMMKGVTQYGTGIRLRLTYGFTNPIAGKTGTTQNQSDGWFMGVTPDLTSGIWTGCEDRAAHFRTITLGQGANMALPIWALYMKKVYADSTLHYSMGDFEPPLKELSVEIDCEAYENNHKEIIEFEKIDEF